MGSSSSCSGIAASTMYTDSSWYTGKTNGTVRVRSCRVSTGLGLGVHHCIVVECPSMDKWVVYEWSSDGASYFACSKIRGQNCMTLGERSLDEVYAAAREASYGASYGSNYNCNHWTECVAKSLGYNITVHWNCSCVLWLLALGLHFWTCCANFHVLIAESRNHFHCAQIQSRLCFPFLFSLCVCMCEVSLKYGPRFSCSVLFCLVAEYARAN